MCVCVRVCVCARAPPAPRQSWLGCVVWMCVLGCGFRLRAAIPGWGVGVCVFVFLLCLYRANHGWVVGACVFVCGLRLYPANPGCGSWCVCVCFGFGLHPVNPGLGVGVCAFVRVLRLYTVKPGWGLWCVCVGSGFGLHPANPERVVGMCVFLCALRLYPAIPGWGVQWGCVCLSLGFGRAPLFLAAVLGCVSLCARAVCTPSFLARGRGVCVSVRVLAFTPPFLAGVLGRVCLCACSACTPPVMVLVCGVGVCAWVRVSAAPRHSWLGCRAVCVCVRAPPVPRPPWLEFVVCGLGVARHLLLCRGSLRVVRAFRFCGTRWPLLLGTCPCALVVASGVPLWRTWWPRMVRCALSDAVALEAPVHFSDAVVPFPSPGTFAPGFTGRLHGAGGRRPRTGLLVPAAGLCRGRGTGLLRVVPVRGPAMGLSLAGPSGVGLGLRALRWFGVGGPGHSGVSREMCGMSVGLRRRCEIGCVEAPLGSPWRQHSDRQEEAPRLKRGGDLRPAGRNGWSPTKRPWATLGGLIAASVTYLSRREGVPPCLRTSGRPHGRGCLSARARNTGLPTVVWRLCLGLGFVVTPPILAGV